jgi:hypothetical protein
MADNSYSKSYVDGAALTETMLDTAYKSLKPDISNTTLLTSGSTSGHFLKSNGDGLAASFAAVPDPLGPFALRNYGLSTSVAAGALTVALKTNAGSDASSSDKINFTYSSNGTTSATYTAVEITGAVSLAITASATLGFTTTAANRVFVYGYYNTATSSVKLAVSAREDLDNGNKFTTTAMGASADNGLALYATAALSVAPRLLGWIQAALNSSKQWQTATKVNVTNHSPGAQYGRVKISDSSGSFSTTSSSPVDVTNLSVSYTSVGRPVQLKLISAGSASSQVRAVRSGEGISADVYFLRDSTTISLNSFDIMVEVSPNPSQTALGVPLGSFQALDFPVAGTYTYKVQAAVGTGTLSLTNAKLVAYEL